MDLIKGSVGDAVSGRPIAAHLLAIVILQTILIEFKLHRLLFISDGISESVSVE